VSSLASYLSALTPVEKKTEVAALPPRRWLDQERHNFLFRFFVEILQSLAAELGVLLEIVMRAVGHAVELAPAHGKEIFDIGSALGVGSQFVLFVLANAQVFLSNPVEPTP